MSHYRALEKKHGTFQEFELALWNAYASLEITKQEMDIALREYRRDLADARMKDLEENRSNNGRRTSSIQTQ